MCGGGGWSPFSRTPPPFSGNNTPRCHANPPPPMWQKAAMNKIMSIVFSLTNMAGMPESARCKG